MTQITYIRTWWQNKIKFDHLPIIKIMWVHNGSCGCIITSSGRSEKEKWALWDSLNQGKLLTIPLDELYKNVHVKTSSVWAVVNAGSILKLQSTLTLRELQYMRKFVLMSNHLIIQALSLLRLVYNMSLSVYWVQLNRFVDAHYHLNDLWTSTIYHTYNIFPKFYQRHCQHIQML